LRFILEALAGLARRFRSRAGPEALTGHDPGLVAAETIRRAYESGLARAGPEAARIDRREALPGLAATIPAGKGNGRHGPP